jgi:hypothetical protein
LSPYPYIILAERPRKFIYKALSEGKLKLLRIQPNFEPVTHLQFMYENMLMGLPKVREAKEIKNLLEIYKEESEA